MCIWSLITHSHQHDRKTYCGTCRLIKTLTSTFKACSSNLSDLTGWWSDCEDSQRREVLSCHSGPHQHPDTSTHTQTHTQCRRMLDYSNLHIQSLHSRIKLHFEKVNDPLRTSHQLTGGRLALTRLDLLGPAGTGVYPGGSGNNSKWWGCDSQTAEQ